MTDSYGNVSNTVTRTVRVVDVIPPIVELLPNVDTVYLGLEYIIPDTTEPVIDISSIRTTITLDGLFDIFQCTRMVIQFEFGIPSIV